ncbi:hypothetical protein Lal_00022984 [Lupinus albus]|nr:hypothetical protein Lal_00022984 [Lupinus albus]
MGKVAEALVLGPGAGAGTSVAAMAALMEAAAMRTAHATFFISIMMTKNELFCGTSKGIPQLLTASRSTVISLKCTLLKGISDVVSQSKPFD